MLCLNLNKMAVKVEYPSPFSSKNLEYLTKVQMAWPNPGPLNLCWATRESAFCLDPFDSDACNHISSPAEVHLIFQLPQAYMFASALYMVCFCLSCLQPLNTLWNVSLDFSHRTPEGQAQWTVRSGRHEASPFRMYSIPCSHRLTDLCLKFASREREDVVSL